LDPNRGEIKQNTCVFYRQRRIGDGVPAYKMSSHDRTMKIVLTALLVVGGIWLGTNRQFYTEAMSSAFFAFALANVIVIHLRIAPSWRDASLILGGTMALWLVDRRILHLQSAMLMWLSFVGLCSLLVFGTRTIWAKGAGRKLLLLGFIPALLFVVSEYFADNLLRWTAAHHPFYLDLYLVSFDSSLRVQIPFAVGKVFHDWPWLRLTAVLFYLGLPIPIALVYAGRLLRYRERAVAAGVAFLATGPIGVIFYNLFPAAGPVHVFLRGFPLHPFPMDQAAKLIPGPIPVNGPPNAIPSLHLAWVLLVWWYSRGLSWWERSIALTFLVFTMLATLGTGEHYFIDLIVAFPFALMIESMCAFSLPLMARRRLLAFCLGLGGTLGWFALLRGASHFFWRSPVLPWSFCIATVVLSLASERLLRRDQVAPARESPVASPVLSSVS
jgi:PAP2 superfamily